ncbi:MAG TPA: DUF4159 domain-containing protein [Tepidisphaeraceae bacterium]|nr:DUF4159 domain-containing protein [Tepidisphaeraceae bacterium]
MLVAVTLSTAISIRAATPEQITTAINKGKTFIYSRQKDGNWELPLQFHGDQVTGQTALAVYALLANGENHQEPRIVKALDYLKKTPTTGVYALGMRCLVWNSLPQTPDVREALAKDAKILLTSIKKTGEGKGFYDYNPNDKTKGYNTYSHSRAQYAVLGLWAASQAGFEVPLSYWQEVERTWIADQDPSGGWSYFSKPGKFADKEYPLTPGMTAVGVATLFITQDFLHANDGTACKGNISNPSIDKGLSWIADNFARVAEGQMTQRDFPYSTWYALERIGVASGYKYITDINWYDRGADFMIAKQGKGGAWPAEFGNLTVASTSLCMLFLARGGSPVAIAKLDYTGSLNKDSAHWNQRPRDVPNVVRWIGKSVERDLNWQVVNLNATVRDLHDSPILYMSGNLPLELSEAEKAKLKQYISEGGMIVANADCQSKEFGDSFRKLGSALFPAYEFRELPADHPIYKNQPYKRDAWKNKPSVLGLSNGVRELMILIPLSDPAKWWQLQLVGGKEELWQLMADIYLYSNDRKSLRKGETYLVSRNDSVSATGSLTIGRLQYAGNWDPEPGGWTRLANVLHNDYKIDLTAKVVKPEAADLKDLKIIHMTGTTKFKFDKPAHDALWNWLQDGGTLIVDSAGGSGDFAQAAEAAFSQLFPAATLAPLPLTNPIFESITGKNPSITYRPFAQKVLGSLKDVTRLQQIEVNKRPLIIYSREDLSEGLVGQPVDGILGYSPETSTDLMARILLGVSNQKVTAPPKPVAKAPATEATTKPKPKGKPPAKPKQPKPK